MLDPGSAGSTRELVDAGLADVDLCVQTIAGHEDDPAMVGYAEYGVPWHEGACPTDHGLQDVAGYRRQVPEGVNAAWMDNTTLLTAVTLLTEAGPEAMTPLTAWDLVTFARAVVCFDHIYHHEHTEVRDAWINATFGKGTVIPLPLPFREAQGGGSPLPKIWDGAHRWMCNLWFDAHQWLRRLHDAGPDTLDGRQLEAVTGCWRHALGRDDIRPEELVNYRDASTRWTSPSNRLLAETADATGVDETGMYIDPTEGFRKLFQRKRDLGMPDDTRERLGWLLSDLNLRSYVNQRIAEFFEVPYVCSAARSPFRRHLYDRALRVQQDLTTAGVIDGRYAELAGGVRLRLPVFCAVALVGSSKPHDLWHRLAELRQRAAPFRQRRAELDAALARRDLKVAARVAKALSAPVDDLLAIAGRATAAAGAAVVESVAQGDVTTVQTGVAATAAAGLEVLQSSFAQRLLWRLRRPHLLWINSLIDQAARLTESLSDFARVWRIPPSSQAAFAERFAAMARLDGP